MSDSTTQLTEANKKLTNARFQDWKERCINKALTIDAYEILTGEETEPTLSPSPTAEERKAVREFKGHKSKIAGYICDTLDAGQLTVISALAVNDGHSIWTALLAHFKSKDTNSRLFATQQHLSLCKGDAGHESENFSDYGTRCISAANLLHNLLPPGASMTAATAASGGVIDQPAVLIHGFTAANLVDKLAIGMIIIGLGATAEECQLKHMLTHMNISTVDKIIEELQKADNLVRSDNLAIASNPSEALVAKAKASSSKPSFQCQDHGRNRMHKTEDCNTLKNIAKQKAEEAAAAKKTKGKQCKHAKAAEDEEAEPSDEEKLMLTQAAQVASPPHC